MTKLLIIAVIIVLAVLYVLITVFASKAKSSGEITGSPKPGESPIEFVVILSKPLQFPEGEMWTTFMDNFREQWGTSMVCGEMDKLSDHSRGMRKFLLTDKIDNILLTYIEKPVDEEMVNLTLAVYNLSDKQKNALINNKAHIIVHYFMGKTVKPVKQVETTLKAVFTLLNLPEAVGYSGISSQHYNPKEKMMPMLTEQTLDTDALFLAGTCIQVTQDKNRMWMHTHGMDQFGVPDLQIKFDDEGQKDRFREAIANAALYLMDRGPVLKPGHTAELAGDGIIYRIKAVPTRERSHFGAHGAIEIERDPQQKPAGS